MLYAYSSPTLGMWNSQEALAPTERLANAFYCLFHQCSSTDPF